MIGSPLPFQFHLHLHLRYPGRVGPGQAGWSILQSLGLQMGFSLGTFPLGLRQTSFLQGPAQASPLPGIPPDCSRPGDGSSAAQSHTFRRGAVVGRAWPGGRRSAVWSQLSFTTTSAKLSSPSETFIIYRKKTGSILPMTQDCCDEEYVKAFCARPQIFLLFILWVYIDDFWFILIDCFIR